MAKATEHVGGGLGQAAGHPARLRRAQTAATLAWGPKEQSHVPPPLLNSYFHLRSAQISVFTIAPGSIYFLHLFCLNKGFLSEIHRLRFPADPGPPWCRRSSFTRPHVPWRQAATHQGSRGLPRRLPSGRGSPQPVRLPAVSGEQRWGVPRRRVQGQRGSMGPTPLSVQGCGRRWCEL